jgi:hypothetical protein
MSFLASTLSNAGLSDRLEQPPRPRRAQWRPQRGGRSCRMSAGQVGPLGRPAAGSRCIIVDSAWIAAAHVRRRAADVGLCPSHHLVACPDPIGTKSIAARDPEHVARGLLIAANRSLERRSVSRIGAVTVKTGLVLCGPTIAAALALAEAGPLEEVLVLTRLRPPILLGRVDPGPQLRGCVPGPAWVVQQGAGE